MWIFNFSSLTNRVQAHHLIRSFSCYHFNWNFAKSHCITKFTNIITQRKLHSFSDVNLSTLFQRHHKQKLTVEENLNLDFNNSKPALRKFNILRSLSVYCDTDDTVHNSLSCDKRFKLLISELTLWSGKLRLNERCEILRFLDVFIKHEVIKEAREVQEINKFIGILHKSIIKYEPEKFSLNDLVCCVLCLLPHMPKFTNANQFMQACIQSIENKYEKREFESVKMLPLIRILQIPSNWISNEIKEDVVKMLEDRITNVETLPKEFSIQNAKHLLIAFQQSNIFHAKLFHRCVVRYRGSLAYDHFTLRDNLEILEMLVNLCYNTDYQPYFALRITVKVLQCSEMEEYFLKHLSHDSLTAKNATKRQMTFAKDILSRISLYMSMFGWYSGNILNELKLFAKLADSQEKSPDENLAFLLNTFDGIRYVFLSEMEYSAVKYYPWQLYLRFARGERLHSKEPAEIESIVNRYKASKEGIVNEFISALDYEQLSVVFHETFAIRNGILYDVVVRFSNDSENSSDGIEVGVYILTLPDVLVEKPFDMHFKSLKSGAADNLSVFQFKYAEWAHLSKTPSTKSAYLLQFISSLLNLDEAKNTENIVFPSNNYDNMDEIQSLEKPDKTLQLLEHLENGLFDIQFGFSSNLSISDRQIILDKIKKKTSSLNSEKFGNNKATFPKL